MLDDNGNKTTETKVQSVWINFFFGFYCEKKHKIITKSKLFMDSIFYKYIFNLSQSTGKPVNK